MFFIGVPSRTSSIRLLINLGSTSLEKRKRLHRLGVMHEIQVKVQPEYLTHLILVLMGERT